MKKTVLFCIPLLALAAVGVLSFQSHQKNLCQTWYHQAQSYYTQGFFADTIRTGMIYLSKPACRGKQDMKLMPLLAKARLMVPLPDQAHLSAHLLMARQGMRLQQNDDLLLAIAEANAVKGQWAEAAHILTKLDQKDHPTALRIRLISAVQQQQKKMIKTLYTSYMSSTASAPEKAIINRMTLNRFPAFQAISPTLPVPAVRLADILFSKKITTADLAFINEIKSQLNDQSLTLAVSAAQIGRHWSVVTALLTQPQRPLKDDLLLKLGKILWQQKNWHKLTQDFPQYARKGHPSSATLLLICMARRATGQPCTTAYDPIFQRRVEGIYVARHYTPLMQAMEAKTPNLKDMINGLDSLDDLRDTLGFTDQFQAFLYRKTGDRVLAAWHDRRARFFNLQPHDFKITIPSPLLPLMQAYFKGEPLSNQQQDMLIKHSPAKSLPWRLIAARRMLAKTTTYKHKAQQQQTTAQAVKTLRPTLKWGGNHFGPHLLMSQAYAQFGDEQNSFNHLLKSTELHPDSAVQACRFAVQLYENKTLNSPEKLVHWWQNITHIELKQKTRLKQRKPQPIMRERLYILAQYAEQKNDPALYRATYEALVRYEPQNDIALNNLAYSLLEKHQGQKAVHPSPLLMRALTLVNKAIQLNPRIKEYESTRQDITTEIELNKIPQTS